VENGTGETKANGGMKSGGTEGVQIMCSGCSGDYEGDSELGQSGPGSTPTSSGDTIDGEAFAPSKLNWPADSRTHTGGPGRNELRNQRLAGQCLAESEYEVLVSADEIIEIYRIAGDFAGW
jgi:hypothetical protein